MSARPFSALVPPQGPAANHPALSRNPGPDIAETSLLGRGKVCALLPLMDLNREEVARLGDFDPILNNPG
jgi:hypothetical protein